MNVTIIGYARTSTTDQIAGLEDQITTLTAHGCERIWSEHASAVGERPELAATLAFLRPGDTFVITRPDRLARSVMDMLKLTEGLLARGVTVRILSMGVDTATPTGKLILTVLAGVAAWEREIMLERQKAGIAKARLAGKYKGRKRKATRADIRLMQISEPGVSQAEIARRLGVHPATVGRALAGTPQPPAIAL